MFSRFFSGAARTFSQHQPKDFVKWAQVVAEDAAGKMTAVTSPAPMSLTNIERLELAAAAGKNGPKYSLKEVPSADASETAANSANKGL